MTEQKKNKRFAELAGVQWHEPMDYDDECACGMQFMGKAYKRAFNKHIKASNPDFSDPREVLKVIIQRDDWDDFLVYSEEEDDWWYVKEFCKRYITIPGLLRDKWIEWRECL